MTFPVFRPPRRPVFRLFFFTGFFLTKRRPKNPRAALFRRASRQPHGIEQGEPNMRYQPGQSGNPAGRPRGARNKRTILAEKLLEDRAGEVTNAAIDLATDGNPIAVRVCMDRVVPRLRHSPLDFALPERGVPQ